MGDDESRAAIDRFNGGRAAVLEAWRQLFADSPDARFDSEELTAFADRAVLRCRYQWHNCHVRGVDLLKVRDGRVAEKLAYVEG